MELYQSDAWACDGPGDRSSAAVPVCKDKWAKDTCAANYDMCHYSNVFENCCASCGAPAPAPDACIDKASNCASLKPNCGSQMVQENCCKTCSGAAAAQPTPPPAPPTPRPRAAPAAPAAGDCVDATDCE